MIKLSDYVTRFLVERGIEDIFLVSGGGIMHLVDSVGRQAGLRYICNHHEQACAIAAESYARRRNHVGACLVTTGPGATNALSAIAGAFVDSVPVLVLSGQVRRDIIADYSRFRQLGPQEINILDMARPVTKYAVTVMDSANIRYELEKAWHFATEGRPGPVWVNLPLDVQGSMIDDETLQAYREPPANLGPDGQDIDAVVDLLAGSERPIWIFGNGVHLAGAESTLLEVVDRFGIPALLTIGGLDLLPEAHPANMGRFGPVGQRRANFALQNADLVLAVGASLSIASIGFNTEGFAPGALKILVNADPSELEKPNLRPDLAVRSDVGAFLKALLQRHELCPNSLDPKWQTVCQKWKTQYPTLTPDYLQDPAHVNTYVFAAELSRQLDSGDTVLTGNSLDIVSIYHSFLVKPQQRVYTNINYGAMGWDLPAAIGACVGSKTGRTVLLTGDGTFQFNLQELLTIRQYQLPIKIFVINNQGYESIRTTQRAYFEGRLVGADPSSGIGNPDFQALALAYTMTYLKIRDAAGVAEGIRQALNSPGAVLCELNVACDQPRSPKVTSVRRMDGTMESRPLHDMFPFLPSEEVNANMTLFEKK